MGTTSLLLRLSGDLSTKSRRTRLRFARRLAANAEDALRSEGIPYRLERQWSRLLVETEDPPAAAVVLARVFGLQSISEVETRAWSSLAELVGLGEEIFRDEVAGRRFAVRARRSGRHIPFRSLDVERDLGTALLPGAAGVDLTAPEVTAQVEVHEGRAHFFTAKVPAPGGLPLGVEGRALALISGGFDSAVASWLMLKRGVGLDYLFFNLGGRAHEQGVARVLKVLADRWSYGDRPRLHAVDLRPVVAHLQERCRPRYWQVLLKRLMIRGAEQAAAELRRPALVTGEAIGQVSSQTLQNLAVISRATRLPILRPLVGFNKDEIIARSREIGTYELSAAVDEYCAILPRYPVTHASLAAVEVEEARLDAGLLAAAVGARRSLDLRALDPAALGAPELEVRRIPAGAVVLDLRSSRPAFEAWHHPEARHLDYLRALQSFRAFDRAATYVACCEVGLKSAHLAERMQQEGYRAFHVPGGIPTLMEEAVAAEDRTLAAQLLAPAVRGN